MNLQLYFKTVLVTLTVVCMFCVPLAVTHASLVPEKSIIATLWGEIVTQVETVIGFGAQAIDAVFAIPKNGLAQENTITKEKNLDVVNDDADASALTSTYVPQAQTGTLLVNVPFSVGNTLRVGGESFFASSQMSGTLTVGGSAFVQNLTVRSAGSFGSLSVTGGTRLATLDVALDTSLAGQLRALGGITTAGADIDTQGGKLFASNVINSLTAGKNVIITGTPNAPIISVKSMGGGGSSAGVTTLNGQTGAVTLVGGTDISISGLTVSASSTLASVRLRGGCSGCVTDTDVADALTLIGGTIDNTVIGSTTPAAAFFTTLSVSGSATSTFGGGINLLSGCFAIAGSCITPSVIVEDIDDLTDVALSTSTQGDLLLFNGTNWINSATSTLGLGDGTFLGLRDTMSSYIANALWHTNATSSALVQSSDLVYTSIGLGVGTSTPLETLSVGGSIGVLGQQMLRLYDADSSHYAALRATSSLLSSVTWTLPASDGSLNQLLVTDGAGNLRFTSIGALGTGPSTFLELSDTVDSYINKAIPYVATSTLTFSNDFVFDGSRVGIGTNAPTSTLTVVGSVQFGPSVGSPLFVYDRTSNNVGIGTSDPTESLTVMGGSFLQRGGTASSKYRPTQSSSIDLPSSANDIQIVGDLAYVVTSSGGDEFHVIDVSDDDAPVVVGSLDLPASANAVAVSGTYAYVVTDISSGEFIVVDISDPANPVSIESVNLPSTAFDVFIQGRYAYIVTDGTGNDLHVIDISNPSVAYVVNSINLSGGGNAIVVIGEYAYIASDALTAEFQIVNIQSPNSLFVVGSLNLSATANDLIVDEQYVYVVTSSTGNDFHTIAIADPTTPSEVGSLELGSTAYGISVTGNYAYVTTADVSDDFHVIDLSAPTLPVVVGSESLSSGSGLAVVVSGTNAYVVTSAVGDDFHIVDITGTEVQSAFVHSLESGNIFTQGDITGGGGISLVGGLRSGSAGLQTDGALFVQGTSSSFFLGSVGIGTSSPSQELTVSGDLRLTGSLYDSVNNAGANGAILRSIGTGQTWVATSTLGLSTAFSSSAELGSLLSDETGSGSVVFSNSPTLTGTASMSGASLSAALVLSGSTANISLGSNYLSGDGGDEGVFVTDSGAVGIGTSTPTQKLSVEGTILASNLLGGATSLSTDAQGNIIRTPSDERLKTNVVTIDDALEKLLALRGVTYSWQDTERFGEQTEIGFLAQEVDLILPEVVRKGGEYWSLNTANIMAVVVEAIKELWGTVEVQKTEIEILKERVLYLETQIGDSQSEAQPQSENETEEDTTEVLEETPPVEEETPEDVPEDGSSETLETENLPPQP